MFLFISTASPLTRAISLVFFLISVTSPWTPALRFLQPALVLSLEPRIRRVREVIGRVLRCAQASLWFEITCVGVLFKRISLTRL